MNGYHEYGSIMRHKHLTKIGVNGILQNFLLAFTTFLIGFWGVYLFLIVISLSDDIKLPSKKNEEPEPWMSREKFSLIKMGAHLMYIAGIGMVFIYILFLLLFVEVIILVLLSPIIIFVLLPYKLLKKIRNKIQIQFIK